MDWSTVVVLIYASFYLTLLLIISCLTYDTKDSNSKWLSKIWTKRGIYSPILVHIYDTSTDIGVIVIWGQLAYKESNNNDFDIAYIDMTTMFILGCVFLGLYRILACIGFIFGGHFFKSFLAIFDLSIIYSVYLAHCGYDDGEMLAIQFGEAISESMPQMLLQSVFIIRTFVSYTDSNNPIYSINDILLIILSIFASLLSIANKFIRVESDENFYMGHATKESLKANYCKNNDCCCSIVSYKYIIRVIWRFMNVMTRILIYIMIWAIIGGAYLLFYLIFELILCLIMVIVGSTMNDLRFQFPIALIYCVSLLPVEKPILWLIRLIDDIICMIVITIFATNKFDCIFCTNSTNRSLFDNMAALGFVIAGWIGIALYSTLMIIGTKCTNSISLLSIREYN